MGYYTKCSIKVITGYVNEHDFNTEMDRLSQCDGWFRLGWNEEHKMLPLNYIKKASKKFKGVVFEIKGNGEEDNDLWVVYIKEGKETDRLKANITYRP